MIELFEIQTNTFRLFRNEFLHTAGSVNTNIYLIDKGSVKIVLNLEQEEQIIRFGYRGNLIVLLDSFLTDGPSKYSVQVIKETELRQISKKTLMNWLNQDEKHLNWWIQTLEELVLQQMEREVDLLITSPKERYERILKRSPQLFQEIPNKHIANYLRMSPETLSRLKKS